MFEYEYLLLFIISLMAFLLKAMTGFGPAIIVISLGSLFILPRDVVVLASVLDLIAGGILLKMEWNREGLRFWLPLSIAIVAGSVVGSLFLKLIPAEIFRLVLSIVILIIGVQFVLGLSKGKLEKFPEKSDKSDNFFSFIGGLCGGFVGIDGPLLVWHFGRKFAQVAFRRVLIPVFFAAAMARVLTYSATGLMNMEVVKYVAVSIPGLLLGIYFGNRIFFKLSEDQFNRIVGVILIVIALKQFLF